MPDPDVIADARIIGVMSDTHGNRALMQRAAGVMRDMFAVELVYHLGDDYADAEELKLHEYPVRMVPGLWCPEYRNPRIPNRLIDQVGGLTIACAHAEKDLRFKENSASVVMTGHTHIAEIEPFGLSVRLNPGHLKALKDRGQAPSFAVIHIKDGAVDFAIHEITGGVRKSLSVPRNKLV